MEAWEKRRQVAVVLILEDHVAGEAGSSLGTWETEIDTNCKTANEHSDQDLERYVKEPKRNEG